MTARPATPPRRVYGKQPDVAGTPVPAAPSKHKIFVNESGPMTFYIPPCADHLNLCDLIKKGGGKIAQKAGKDAINIVPESAKHKKIQRLEDATSSRFIVDCTFQQKTLPLGDYRLGPPMRKPAAAPGRPSQARRARTREKYTREDDVALKEWVKKNVGLKSQGKELWVRAVQAKVTGHSWQSMQNRYRRHLKPKKGQALRKSLALGARPTGVEDIEDFSQRSGDQSKVNPAAPSRVRSAARGSLTDAQVAKMRRRSQATRPRPEPGTGRATGGALQPSTSAVLGASTCSLPLFWGVPTRILERQDVQTPVDMTYI
ncbi:unnamed protein product [Durusdinium trenchii]|uniref:Telomeric repeat-binding factor 2-interacting protein 1 n=2 Tax=Durusdinium trenchii TaxID=1381693 RepID=A0ABP0IWM6_9DINO